MQTAGILLGMSLIGVALIGFVRLLLVDERSPGNDDGAD
jgi:hypothetical protein